jgi:pyroglutamyl-peptidase
MPDASEVRGLITAYEPFQGRPENQSQEVLKLAVQLPQFPAAWRHALWPAILPELAGRVEQALPEDEACPEVWLALGESGLEGLPALETVARNRWDLSEDAKAAAGGPASGVFEEDGPPWQPATWPATLMAKALRLQGHEVELSEDAGSHCCNGLLWLATRRVTGPLADRTPWVGFLHLPRQPEARAAQAALVADAAAWLAARRHARDA